MSIQKPLLSFTIGKDSWEVFDTDVDAQTLAELQAASEENKGHLVKRLQAAALFAISRYYIDHASESLDAKRFTAISFTPTEIAFNSEPSPAAGPKPKSEQAAARVKYTAANISFRSSVDSYASPYFSKIQELYDKESSQRLQEELADEFISGRDKTQQIDYTQMPTNIEDLLQSIFKILPPHSKPSKEAGLAQKPVEDVEGDEEDDSPLILVDPRFIHASDEAARDLLHLLDNDRPIYENALDAFGVHPIKTDH